MGNSLSSISVNPGLHLERSIQLRYLAFTDLAKAFDLVSRSGLFTLLKKKGCPPKLLAIVESFHKDMFSTYLGSTITSNLSLEPEINSRIAQTAEVMSKLHKTVWSNQNLTVNAKMQVFRACVLSTLLYSGETWTTYAAQEKRLNSFYLQCLIRILGIRWQDKIPNTEVLQRAGLPTVFAILS
ncbi:uncharacterized protein LOC143281405 [Babylonia areolata]|uniref:uncharacterized protein LOC143281405 n=1 Tax=Babylonia areolata TaxID=304850 RepID=UPI003FD0A2F5